MGFDYQHYLDELERVKQQLAKANILQNPAKLKALSQRHSELQEIVNYIHQIRKTKNEIRDNQELIAQDDLKDQELINLAEQELDQLQVKLKKFKKRFELLTIPRDPLDERDVILEIRAGAGGDEAGLFACELFRMYSRYAEKNNMQVTIINSSQSGIGSIKEMIAQIQGANAYGNLKYESGVHRVQRIPETEKSGRVHTSTATVAVLPKAEETDIEIKPEQVKVDTFRSSGPGGQSVNTTDSAIRLTHLPTGLVVTCQDEKSQHKNKAKAFSVLRSRLLEARRAREQAKIDNLRSSQIGTGDRSEKIRTYNYPQDRITDHRIKYSWNGIEDILQGGLDKIIKQLKQFDQGLKLKKIKDNHEASK
ncbi:MAG: peptide chain release factor 1 [Candidatus Moranbacteria bacterium]|nr:peptide chain release factor 1 [Candidatus Moranbacteria bacterium]